MAAEQTERGDPIYEGLERTLRNSTGTGTDVVVNVSQQAQHIVGLDVGDNVDLHVYHDHVELWPQDDE